MRKVVALLILLLATLPNALPQSSRVINDVASFRRLVLASSINVLVVPSQKNKITINGERSVIANVVCSVQDDELSIFANKFKWKRSKVIDIILEVDTSLVSISANSGNKVRFASRMKCGSLTLDVRNGSMCYLNVDASYLKIKSSYGGDVKAVGTANYVEIVASNGCIIEAFGLAANDVNITASLSSKVDVSVSDNLNVSTEDECEVRYMGSPRKNIIAKGISSVYELKKQ